MSLVDRSRRLAIEAHAGQMRRDGTPHIEHPLRVAEAVKADGYGELAVAAALLHDSVEDNPSVANLDRFRREGFPQRLIESINTLTRQDDDNYSEYIDRMISPVLPTEIASVVLPVKYHDIHDNFTDIPDESPVRMAARLEKYRRAEPLLVKRMGELGLHYSQHPLALLHIEC